MIPRIAERGHSFKGASHYYLHDKEANTNERVAWTYTHNLPTDDPEKAMNWMAYTSMNAERLKHNAGVSKVGRKSTAGCVYSFSLAWHPTQSPKKESMQESALTVLLELGLEDHEAVFVAHNDTSHPHVHVVCNLVHPDNGKMAVPSYDFLTTSRWAEEFERQDGKILCEQRVINNQKRRQNVNEKRQLALVKHKEEKLEKSLLIQSLYNQADSGKAFQAGLKEAGYTLAQGDRRGFGIVDAQGKIHSLSRQLKGQRSQDIKTRLNDIHDLPLATEITHKLQNDDKQRVKTEQPELLKTANQKEETEYFPEKSGSGNDEKRLTQSSVPELAECTGYTVEYDQSHLHDLDKLRNWEQEFQKRRCELAAMQEEYYERSKILQQINVLQRQRPAIQRFFERISGQAKARQEFVEALGKNLENVDQRIEEQNGKLRSEAFESKPQNSPECERQKRLEYILNRQNRTLGRDLE